MTKENSGLKKGKQDNEYPAAVDQDVFELGFGSSKPGGK